jgi:hypothetical protein
MQEDTFNSFPTLQKISITAPPFFPLSRKKTTIAILPKVPITHNTQLGFMYHKFLNNSPTYRDFSHASQYSNATLKPLYYTFPKPSHVAKQQPCQLLENSKPIKILACSNLGQTMYCSTSENTTINTHHHFSSDHQTPFKFLELSKRGFKSSNPKFWSCVRGAFRKVQ